MFSCGWFDSKKSKSNSMQLPYNFDKKTKRLSASQQKMVPHFLCFTPMFDCHQIDIQSSETKGENTRTSFKYWRKKTAHRKVDRMKCCFFLRSQCYGINLLNIWHSFCWAFGIEHGFGFSSDTCRVHAIRIKRDFMERALPLRQPRKKNTENANEIRMVENIVPMIVTLIFTTFEWRKKTFYLLSWWIWMASGDFSFNGNSSKWAHILCSND